MAQRSAASGRITHRLSEAPLRAALRQARARLEGVAGQLEAVSPEAVLRRGYVLVFDRKDVPITTAGAVRPGTELRLHFADGDVRAAASTPKRDRQGNLPL